MAKKHIAKLTNRRSSIKNEAPQYKKIVVLRYIVML